MMTRDCTWVFVYIELACSHNASFSSMECPELKTKALKGLTFLNGIPKPGSQSVIDTQVFEL